jgi:MoaA/NifB/PqqE/SkfB family radical SAM enzyme
LYCSPKSEGTFKLNQIKDALDEIRKIETVDTVSFEGGEPFLYFPLLLESIKLATEKGFNTAIETNTYWATSEEDAAIWLQPLHEAGLQVIEVSDDSFHHDDEIFNTAKYAVSAANKVGMGTFSICINQPGVENINDQMKGKPIYFGEPKLRGRAVEKLVEGLQTKPWEKLTECPFEDLRNPDRLHIDSYGTVHLCQGLSMGNMWETPLSELLNAYSPDLHPICGPLLNGGPAQLAREYNIAHDEEYVDACHFCSKMCLSLIDRFPEYLTPRQVYGLS